MKFLAATALLAVAMGGAARAQGVVTVYSADGLHDGSPNWYAAEFGAFTKATGIKVRYVEGGSAIVVDRIAQERANPQADVLVTLPPFIQKAGASGLLQPYAPKDVSHIPADSKAGDYTAMINNYPTFIYDTKALSAPPQTFNDLLAPKFHDKIQYSTPGEAGDGTAVMLEVLHLYGDDAGFAYLKKLQANNLGPSASTGKLTALVNKGEIYVANGDLQMNMAQLRQNPNIRMFYPAGPQGQRVTFALPYDIGLVHGAPHQANGKKLIDFLLSRPAQAQVSAIAEGLPVRDDVHPDDQNFKTLHAQLAGVTIWTPDWNRVTHHLNADLARYRQATGS